MIIWSGRGVLAGVFISFSHLILSVLGVDDNAALSWGFLIAAPLTFFLGRAWNSPRMAIDPDTGEEVLWTPNHTFFWIPMQYWGLIFLVVGIFMLVTD